MGCLLAEACVVHQEVDHVLFHGAAEQVSPGTFGIDRDVLGTVGLGIEGEGRLLPIIRVFSIRGGKVGPLPPPRGPATACSGAIVIAERGVGFAVQRQVTWSETGGGARALRAAVASRDRPKPGRPGWNR